MARFRPGKSISARHRTHWPTLSATLWFKRREIRIFHLALSLAFFFNFDITPPPPPPPLPGFTSHGDKNKTSSRLPMHEHRRRLRRLFVYVNRVQDRDHALRGFPRRSLDGTKPPASLIHSVSLLFHPQTLSALRHRATFVPLKFNSPACLLFHRCINHLRVGFGHINLWKINVGHQTEEKSSYGYT